MKTGNNMILNPNCSELVTHIGPKDKADVVNALIKMNDRIRGWTLITEAWYGDGRFQIRLPNDDMENAIRFGKEDEDDEDEDIQPDIDFLVKYHKIPKKDIKKFRKDMCWTIKLVNEFDEDYRIVDDRNNSFTYLSIHMFDGYTDYHGLTAQCSQHCCTSEFPALHAIRTIFGTDYRSYDGGSPVPYESWMGKDAKATEKHIVLPEPEPKPKPDTKISYDVKSKVVETKKDGTVILEVKRGKHRHRISVSPSGSVIKTEE